MKQLLILSGKGGTGKTTVASAFINLSDAKAYADCDVDAPNLHLVLGALHDVITTDYYGLPKAKIDKDKCLSCGLCRQHCRFDAIDEDYTVDIFACEGCGVCEAICPAGAVTLREAVAGELMLYKNEKVFSTAQLKMGSGTSGMLVTEVKKQMTGNAKEADLAIIDGSPGIGCPVIASISGVDMVLLVTEPSISGISDMERIIKTAQKFFTPVAVCVNKYDTNLENTQKIEKFCKANDLPFVGKIPYDKEAIKAVNQGKSIVQVPCEAGEAVKDIYKETLKILNKE